MICFYIFIAFFMSFSSPTTSSPTTQESSRLEVTISNVRNDEGYLLITMFNSASGFPDDNKKAFETRRVNAERNTVNVIFEDLPHGVYAIAVVHDENDNGKLDKNLVGAPTEGYGSSNNLKKMFRAPNFEESKFTVDQNFKKVTIQVNY